MNNQSSATKNFLNLFNTFIKKNYKIILAISAIFFLFFIGYQYYKYLKIKNIHKNSVIYFNAIETDLVNEDFYNIMQNLSTDNDFFSVISIFEMINYNFNKKNYDLSKQLYQNLLENNNLKSSYKSAIAAHAGFSFLEVTFDTHNSKFFETISYFIDHIDDNLDSYNGIKLELKFLLAIAKQDINNLNPNNDKETIDLYNQIMESEKISSSIKERVKKINEFQIYK